MRQPDTAGLPMGERLRLRRKDWLARGLCQHCGKREQRPGRKSCEYCAEGYSLRNAMRRSGEAREKRGLKARGRGGFAEKPGECTRCTAPRMKGKDVCEGHWATLQELRREASR